jgi:hypothetical protein
MQQQQYRYGCTCAREPSPVKYYTTSSSTSTSNNRSSSITDNDDDDDDDAAPSSSRNNNNNNIKGLLIENLRTHGWSPIIVSDAPSPSPSKDLILSIFRRRRQRQQQIHSQQCNNNNNNNNGINKNDYSDESKDVVFISAESGSSDGKVEPKESLEIELSKCCSSSSSSSSTTTQQRDHDHDDDDDDDDDDDEHTIKTWCKTLSWIANEIICNEILDVPKNSFLSKDPNQSLDLLRIFHYYKNDKNNSSNKQQKQTETENDTNELLQLGSSEHTDWGSLTIVWQDTVGGLQTYCRACNKWINVRAAATETTTTDEQDDDIGKENNHHETTNQWTCIVHVGDMASLMLDDCHSLSKCNSSDRSDNNITSGKQDNIVPSSSSSFFTWPSPLHRVISPPNEERVSLVYFGYPPRGLSLDQIQNNILNEWKPSLRGRRQPLDDYYLLRNQSVVVIDNNNNNAGDTTNNDSNDKLAAAEETYQNIWNIPIEDIVQYKWKQVNRED